jgi:integrase
MANIKTRTDSKNKKKYNVRIRLKGFPTQSATFDRLTDAKKWAQQTESAMREGRHFKTIESKRHTLTELIDRYIKQVMPTKPKSAKDQTTQLNWWKDQIGCYLLADVTPPLLSEYRDILSNQIILDNKTRAPSTINRYIAALSHVFTIAVKEWGWLDDNPFRKVSKQKEPRGRVRYLSDEERVKLLDVCRQSNNPYLYTIVVLALSTGARKNELLSLTWDKIDLGRQVITLLETKNGEIRILPLVEHAFDLMKQHSNVRLINTNLVFPGQKPQKPMDIRSAWEAALNKAGIEDFRFHDLRHSAASYLAMNGATLAEIAEVLGHKTLQMVKRYSHLSHGHMSKVVASMNEKIFG